MQFSLLILLLLGFCSSSLAAPPFPTDQISSSLRLHTPTPIRSSNTDHTSSTRTHNHHPPSALSKAPQPHPRPTPVGAGGPVGHFPPFPTRPIHSPPAASDVRDPHEHHHLAQTPIAIFFEVLGGLLGLAALVSCLRCCYHYNRTPKRDRISAILERHQLERELAELERNPLALRRSPTSDPLPVYFPPPPNYEAATVARPAPAVSVQRSDYTEVATTSPSSSPTSSPHLPTRQLESALPASTIPRPNIPPAPDG